jgi:hypothetical protein
VPSRPRDSEVGVRTHYKTAGGSAGKFQLGSLGVRLEPRLDAVVVGWTVKQKPATIAKRLAALDETGRAFHVVHEGKLEEGASARALLTNRLRSTRHVELIRVDSDGQSVVWEAGSPGGSDELSIVARSWEEARRLLDLLGETRLGSQLFDLVKMLP